jgi:hypothetical protein
MLFIVPFLFLFIALWIVVLLISSGIIVASKDGSIKVKKEVETPAVEPKKQKAFIDLGAMGLIELQTKAEETKAKKDGYKVVYR